MKWKKTVALGLAALMVLGAAGCGGQEGTPESKPSNGGGRQFECRHPGRRICVR